MGGGGKLRKGLFIEALELTQYRKSRKNLNKQNFTRKVKVYET